jgi:hypothetical protein
MYQLGDFFFVPQIYNKTSLVACHHCVQTKKFHNGPWLFVLPSHLGHSLRRQNKAILQINQKWPVFMLTIHVYPTSLRPYFSQTPTNEVSKAQNLIKVSRS